MPFTGVIRNETTAAQYLNGVVVAGVAPEFGEIEVLEGVTLRSLPCFGATCLDRDWKGGEPWAAVSLGEDMSFYSELISERQKTALLEIDQKRLNGLISQQQAEIDRLLEQVAELQQQCPKIEVLATPERAGAIEEAKARFRRSKKRYTDCL
jgi:hypothetical protein